MEANQNNNLQSISKIISQSLEVDCVLCFGKSIFRTVNESIFKDNQEIHKTSARYDLLVISDTKQFDLALLLNDIRRNLDPAICVNLLVYSIDDINEAVVKGSFFFSKILHKADQIYLNSLFKITLPDRQSDDSSRVHEWQNSITKAMAFYKTAHSLLQLNESVPAVKLTIWSLRTAAVGLLQFCMHYPPKIDELDYLLQLCNILSDKFERVFSPKMTISESSMTEGISLATAYCFYQQSGEFLKIAKEVFKEWSK